MVDDTCTQQVLGGAGAVHSGPALLECVQLVEIQAPETAVDVWNVAARPGHLLSGIDSTRRPQVDNIIIGRIACECDKFWLAIRDTGIVMLNR